MLTDRSLEIIQQIEELFNQLKLIIYTPSKDELEIFVRKNNDEVYAHIWDAEFNSHPRIIATRTVKDDKELIKVATDAIYAALWNTRITKKKIKWVSDVDWNSLPEAFIKLEEILTVEKVPVPAERR